MRVFEYDSVPESYVGLLEAVLNEGTEVSPRGMLTKEITPVTVVINNPQKRLITHPVRKPNYGFYVGELFWILQGSNDLSVSHYNKQWLNFSDNGENLNGAYGQRIFNWFGGFEFRESEEGSTELNRIFINQFQKVVDKLKTDKDSRQGTIVLFDPSLDFNETKDVPCTNLMRFSIRNNKLNMMVVMRSNDLIKGYVYDIFNFTMIQEMMASILDVEVGKYTHVADSLHLYETDFELAKEIISTPNHNVYEGFDIMPIGKYTDEDIKKSFLVEQITRENGNEVELDTVIEYLGLIQNKYFQSLSAVLATYNFRKYGRSQEEVDALKLFINNEFSRVETIQQWKTLLKKQ
jgi:Thymidylate synthase